MKFDCSKAGTGINHAMRSKGIGQIFFFSNPRPIRGVRFMAIVVAALLANHCEKLEYDHTVPEALKTNPTVLDYFMYLPKSALPSWLRDTPARRQTLATSYNGFTAGLRAADPGNGFMELTNGGSIYMETVQVVLWKRRGAPDLIGVLQFIQHSGPDPQVPGTIEFYSFSDGKWSKETSGVFPEDVKGHDCRLPRFGTTIACGANTQLIWNGRQFLRSGGG